MKKHLMIPVIDNGLGLSRSSWALSLAAACLGHLRNFDVTLTSISYPYCDGALNIATQDFLESDCDEMLVIDTDVIFTNQHLEWLFSHDAPLVYGLYPKKKLGLEFPCVPLESDPQPFAEDGRGPLREVARVARGFMRVHRSVFEGLKPHVKKIVCAETGRDQWVFWKPLDGGHSEDFAFCDLYRSHGGKVLVDSRICAQHEGSAVYPIKGTY